MSESVRQPHREVMLPSEHAEVPGFYTWQAEPASLARLQLCVRALFVDFHGQMPAKVPCPMSSMSAEGFMVHPTYLRTSLFRVDVISLPESTVPAYFNFVFYFPSFTLLSISHFHSTGGGACLT
jgi:hypothetical protein